MADGQFTSVVSKDRDANLIANPIWVNLSDGTTGIAIDGSGFLTVNVNGTVTVSASDLDIRNLSETTDQVLVFANTVKDGSGTDYVPLVDADGKLIISNPGGTEYVEDAVAAASATGTTTLVERDDVLTTITPIEGDWTKLYASSKGALWVSVDGSVVVTATDLDIRNLVHATDSVSIGDGTETLNITAAGEAEIDIAAQSLTAVKISATAAANTELNPIFVKTSAAVSGTEVHDYDTASAIASDASDNHDYSITGTLLLKSVIVSGSGNIKFEIQVGPTASLATVAVGFLTGRQGDTKQVNFEPAVEVPDTTTGIVRIIRTNRQGAATDLYSTIIGNLIA